ncbi:hypothetical protein [Nocardia sp. CA-119907]|uniref:hypothetical protein n=1 Tax=Nocardia sp. CA-119907 TaxID=3239973 RepID=UPI003D96665D
MTTPTVAFVSQDEQDFIANSTPTAEPPLIMAMVDGKMLCGAAGLDRDGTLSLRAEPLNEASFVIVVTACPTYR